LPKYGKIALKGRNEEETRETSFKTHSRLTCCTYWLCILNLLSIARWLIGALDQTRGNEKPKSAVAAKDVKIDELKYNDYALL